MESLLVGSFAKSTTPSFPSAMASGSFFSLATGVSRVRLGWNTIRLEHSTSSRFERFCGLKSTELNHPENSSEYHKKFHLYHRGHAKFSANAASESSPLGYNGSGIRHTTSTKSVTNVLTALYRFSRPYTLKGTVLSVISVSLLAIQKFSDFTPLFFLGMLQAIVGASLANLYVVGINQLSDIEIDRVNKPYLALPSGQVSIKTGILLTLLYAILGFSLGWNVNSWPLKLGLSLWYVFGTAYTVNIPLLRWKKVPVLAAMCLWSVQGAIVPILFHLHVQTYVYGRPPVLPKHAMFVAGLMSVYGIVFALFKDIPDVEGDKINGIQSFAVQFGQKRMFWICIWLLEMAYCVATLICLSSPYPWIKSIMALGHGVLATVLWKKANSVDLKSNEALESFYLFIWKLYYAEYLLVPILRF